MNSERLSPHLRAQYGIINYHKCTIAELRAFHKSKTGEEAPITKEACAKDTLLKVLRKIDRTATFRFMDLPPEMRNLIYEQLLSNDRSSHPPRDAYTAILRTSR